MSYCRSAVRRLAAALVLPLLGYGLAALGAGIERLPARAAVALREAAPDGMLVRLASGSFDPLRQSLDYSAVHLDGEVAEPDYGLVQLHQGATTARKELEAAGVVFFGYVPDNTFQVRLTPQSRKLLASHPSVRWLGPWAPGYKVSPRLWPGAEAFSQ